jgi:uncharacterized protein (TIGR00369 family)
MSEPQAAPPIPAGFDPVPMGGPFIAANGPFYVSSSDRGFRLGLRIERRHCNTMGHAHGGLLMAFCDMLMPLAMYDNHPQLAPLRRFLPTVGLQIDFIGPAHAGDWLEGEPQVLKVTRSMVFAQGLVHAHGQLVARCSGSYKISSAMPPGHPGMYTNQAPPTLPKRA